jgi:hypothetical protein
MYHGDASVLAGAAKGGRDSSGDGDVCGGYGGDPLKGMTATGPPRAGDHVKALAGGEGSARA